MGGARPPQRFSMVRVLYRVTDPIENLKLSVTLRKRGTDIDELANDGMSTETAPTADEEVGGDGRDHGAAVECCEGAGVGRRLGLTDGFSEGRGEGAVGVDDGCAVGSDVGRAVGAGQVPFASFSTTPHAVAAHGVL